MENLSKKAREYVAWLDQLRVITADAAKCEPEEIKIDEEEAYKYFKDGYTPTQCFREEYSPL